MQCVTPMFRRYRISNYKKGQIVPREEVMQGLALNPNNIRHCLDKVNKYEKLKCADGYQYETIPCNHCWACKLNYSAQWATRLTYQCKESEHNYFITLTYNNSYLPIAECMDLGDLHWDNLGDEKFNEGTLHDEHMKKFIHSLREYMRSKGAEDIKYFYCGEYGETTHRPHYHMILMNCPLDIKQFYDFHIDERYKAHWKSREIEKYWRQNADDPETSLGMIDVAEAEWSSCAYVARYCMKKLHDKGVEEYCAEGKMPEYVRMSKGIGKKYYEEHKMDIYKNDQIIMKTIKGNVGAFKPPKAWDKLFKEEFPEEWKIIQQSRKKCAERSRKAEKYYTDQTDLQKLQIKFESITVKGKQLPRVGEW